LARPKIADLRRAVGGQQDVGRLQVAVDHAAPMRVVGGAGQLLRQRGGLGRGQ
jgi:hypothetical protein